MRPTNSQHWLSTILLSLLLSSHLAQAQLVSKGFSATIGSIDYYVSPYSVGSVVIDASALNGLSITGLYPVTVVQEAVDIEELTALITNYTQQDDVYQTAFSQATFLAGAKAGQATVSGNPISVFPLNNESIPSGPYFMEASTGSLYMIYRLYADTVGAFTQGLLQIPDGSFQTLSAQTDGSAMLTVGVPSRLYYTQTAEKPLAGIRIGIKDIYDLAGVKKSNGNRAWYNLYPPAVANAVPVQRLIDAGAVIVGHQKTSQFANGEMATADWVDYHSPFNPRGDGYQDPSSSSAGAGASIAAYDWLDLALGSDTGGSIRGPAGVNGLFGNRPSHGLVSLDGVMPLSPVLDTAGFEVRDPYLWNTANSVLYGDNYTSYETTTFTPPSQIYTLNFPTNASTSPQAAIYIDFLNQLSSFLSTNITTLNLTAAWAATSNHSTPLPELLNTTYPALISIQQTTLVRDPFYSDYAAIHSGRRPAVDPAPLIRWSYSDSLPTSALSDALANKTTFMTWFNTHILPVPSSPSSCATAPILIYPATLDPGMASRTEYLDPPAIPFGFSSSRIAVFAETPDFVFPIGQVAVHSNVTGHDELFPVAVDVLAPKGYDGFLVRLARELVANGTVKVPQVGGTIYGGEILYRRGLV